MTRAQTLPPVFHRSKGGEVMTDDAFRAWTREHEVPRKCPVYDVLRAISKEKDAAK